MNSYMKHTWNTFLQPTFRWKILFFFFFVSPFAISIFISHLLWIPNTIQSPVMENMKIWIPFISYHINVFAFSFFLCVFNVIAVVVRHYSIWIISNIRWAQVFREIIITTWELWKIQSFENVFVSQFNPFILIRRSLLTWHAPTETKRSQRLHCSF